MLEPSVEETVLILHGRQDRMVPVARADELQRGIPSARLQILEGGHQVHSEQFATVLPLLIDFVEEVERGRT